MACYDMNISPGGKGRGMATKVYETVTTDRPNHIIQLKKYLPPSGNTDNAMWYGKCTCGWQSVMHSNRTAEGRMLADRDITYHKGQQSIVL